MAGLRRLLPVSLWEPNQRCNKIKIKRRFDSWCLKNQIRCKMEHKCRVLQLLRIAIAILGRKGNIKMWMKR